MSHFTLLFQYHISSKNYSLFKEKPRYKGQLHFTTCLKQCQGISDGGP